MELKIQKNLNECSRIWENLSPNQKLFDIWEFRRCFYDKDDNQPYFMIGREKGKTVGVIPLCFVKSTGQYTYFGGWFPERNNFFMNDRTKLAELLEQCPYNTIIEGIDPKERRFPKLMEDEYTYYIDLARYNNDFDTYFSSFDRKKQKNFRRELQNIPKHKVHYNRLRDFKRLVDLNIKQFDEESIYNNKTIKEGIGRMLRLAHKEGRLHMISVEIGRKIEAVDVAIKCGKWYHVVTGSSNNQKVSNLGKLMTVLDIKNAIATKSRYVDFLASSGYWKSQWSFDKAMLLKFLK